MLRVASNAVAYVAFWIRTEINREAATTELGGNDTVRLYLFCTNAEDQPEQLSSTAWSGGVISFACQFRCF